MLLNKPEQALETLTLLRDNLKSPEMQEQTTKIIELIQDDLKEGGIVEDLASITELTIFPQQNRLCSIYQGVKIPLRKYP